jgi:cell division protein FtsB
MVATINLSRYTVLVLVLVFLIVYLQVDLWHTDHGVRGVYALEDKLTLLDSDNLRAEMHNKSMYDDIQSLHSNNQVIEGMARMELGYIKKGEIFYQIVSNGDS